MATQSVVTRVSGDDAWDTETKNEEQRTGQGRQDACSFGKEIIMKYICDLCGYVYDEEVEGTPFADLPDDYACPECGAGKDEFSPA